MTLVAGGDEIGIFHHSRKGLRAAPPAAPRGTPGPLMIERPISAVEAMARRIALPSSETASSASVGTLGNSGLRFSAA